MAYLYDFILKGETEANSKYKYILVYTLLTVSPHVISFIRFLIITFFQVKAIRKIHNNMIIKAFHGDLLRFFDKVPIARIINKFSNDITTIEDSFIYSISALIISLALMVNSMFITCVNISPFLIIFFIVYLYIIFKV